MNISINTDQIFDLARKIAEVSNDIHQHSDHANKSEYTHGFSTAPGLDQLGIAHGQAISAPTSSAVKALDEFAKQVHWISIMLKDSIGAVGRQDLFSARGLSMTDVFGRSISKEEYFKPQPMPTISPFSFASPIVAPSPNLEMLAQQFHSTDNGKVTATAHAWNTLGSQVQKVVADLGRISSEMTAGNQGEIINKAAEKIQGLKTSGENFVTNAGTMSASVSTLNGIHAAGSQIVKAMQAIVAANSMDPARALLIEQSLLQSFPSVFTPQVLTGVPVIRHLMEIPPATGHGGSARTGMTPEGSLLHPDIASVVPAGQMAESLARVVEDDTGLSLQRPGTIDFPHEALSRIGTQAAQAVSGALHGSPLHHGISGPGLHPATTTHSGVGGFSPPHTQGMGLPNGYSTLGSGTGAGTGVSGAGGSYSGYGSPGKTMGSLGVAGASPFGAYGTYGAPASPLSSGTGSGVGAGTGAGSGAGAGRGVPSGVTGYGSGSPTTAGSGGAMRGQNMVMGPGAAGTQPGQRRKGRVKTITSAVEREGNLLDLLGPRPKVVPRVIGDWVRG